MLGNITGGSALVAMLTTPRCTVRSRRPPAAAGAQPRRESPGELSTSARFAAREPVVGGVVHRPVSRTLSFGRTLMLRAVLATTAACALGALPAAAQQSAKSNEVEIVGHVVEPAPSEPTEKSPRRLQLPDGF